jgi:hypothetical protein
LFLVWAFLFIYFKYVLFQNKFIRLVGWHRLAVAIVYCRTTAGNESDNIVQQPIVVELKQTPEQFTHKFLLQQTCTLSVNVSCQMITIALVALSDASQKYKYEIIISFTYIMQYFINYTMFLPCKR